MGELSAMVSEKARKALARLLHSLQTPGKQGALAVALGTSDSTISRLKTEKLEDVVVLIYALGFKIVDAERICVDAQALEFMRQSTARMLATQEAAAQLWDDE